MTGITHLLVGAAVGRAIKNPPATAGLAFASHFLLDALPHNDYFYFYFGGDPFSLGTVTGFSLLLALPLIFLALKGKKWWKVGALGAFMGILPDAITGLSYSLGYQEFWFNLLHRGIHTKIDLGEVFFRLSGGAVTHSEEIVRWRENFETLRSSPAAQWGWWLELGLEIILIALLFRHLRKAA